MINYKELIKRYSRQTIVDTDGQFVYASAHVSSSRLTHWIVGAKSVVLLQAHRREGKAVGMFARTVRMQLKPESASAFVDLMEKEVIPLLRKQDGFQDEIAFVRPSGTMAVGISLWENRDDADAYQREVLPAGVDGALESHRGDSSSPKFRGDQLDLAQGRRRLNGLPGPHWNSRRAPSPIWRSTHFVTRASRCYGPILLRSPVPRSGIVETVPCSTPLLESPTAWPNFRRARSRVHSISMM